MPLVSQLTEGQMWHLAVSSRGTLVQHARSTQTELNVRYVVQRRHHKLASWLRATSWPQQCTSDKQLGTYAVPPSAATQQAPSMPHVYARSRNELRGRLSTVICLTM